MCGSKEMNVDVLETMLMGLNDDHVKVQTELTKTIKALKCQIAAKNKTLQEKTVTMQQKQKEIASLAALILTHNVEVQEKEATNNGLKKEVKMLKNKLKRRKK